MIIRDLIRATGLTITMQSTITKITNGVIMKTGATKNIGRTIATKATTVSRNAGYLTLL